MAADVVMPRLSDSMEEGTVLGWMKSVGDDVAVGDELVEIETDKANMVYEADEAGTLIEIIAEEGATLPIGEVIARIGDAGEAAEEGGDAEQGEPGARSSEPGAAPEDAGEPEEAGAPEGDDGGEADGPSAEDEGSGESAPSSKLQAPSSPPPSSDGERVKASPLARRIAEDQGVDLASLSGSGPGGRIIRADVEGAERPDESAPEEAGEAQIPDEQVEAER